MHEVEAMLREYDRARADTDRLWTALSADEVTWRPDEHSSAIGWYLGHQTTTPQATSRHGNKLSSLVCSHHHRDRSVHA